MNTPVLDPQLADDGDAPSTGFNPLQILLERWPFLIAGLVLGVVIGALIHKTAVPQYESKAQVLVVKKRTELVKEGDIRVGAVEDYVATQVTLIKSEKIRLAAARMAREIGGVNLPADDQVLAGVINAGLTVSREGAAAETKTSILNLSFRGGDPVTCRVLLEAVIKAHQAELFSIYDKAAHEKLESIDKLMGSLKRRREKAGEERIDRITKLRDITSEEVASIRTRVSTNREQARQMQLELTDIEDQLMVAAKAGTDPQARQLTLTQLTLAPLQTARPSPSPGSTGPSEPVSALKLLERQRRELTSRVGLGDGHPRIQALDEQIHELRDELRRPVQPGADVPDELAAYVTWLEQKKKSIKRKLAALEEQRAEDEDDLKESGGLQDQADALAAQMQQADTEIKRLESDKFAAQATEGAGGYAVEQLSPPGDGSKVAPVLVRSLITGLGIGAGIGVFLMLLVDFSDQSFRSPADVRHRLGVPVIGHIPIIRKELVADATPGGLDPALATTHRPKSVEAEAYRGLRTQLFFSTQGKGHQVIQVTSPSAGDGKSTQSANLAVSIAQSGRRVVLIDCDFRKPTQHKLFRLGDHEAGVAGVVADACTLAEATVVEVVPGLDVIPCGARPANPAELLMSPQFQQLLTELRRRYDFVLIDSPPLLAVTDPAIVAPQVDGVILVFRMTSKVRPMAKRAREILSAVGGNVLGVVVNAANRRSIRYGYGQYGGYGGNRAYAYGGGYRYYNYSDDYAEAAEPDARTKRHDGVGTNGTV